MTLPHDEWRVLLAKRFPQGDPAEQEMKWKAVKTKLAIGQSVTGTVVARAHFGVWLDLGVEFPALLLIVNIRDLTPEKYRNDQWCPLGDSVVATVGGLIEEKREVYVWQVNNNMTASEVPSG